MRLALEVPYMHQRTKHQLVAIALLLTVVTLWIVCILLLITVTTTLLDTLRFIVDLAQMS
jgi:hypothetical protein